MESSYCRYVRVTKVTGCVPEALRLVAKLGDETTSEDVSATRGVLVFTCLDRALLSSANERDVLLYIEDAEAHTRGQKQSATFNGRSFY